MINKGGTFSFYSNNTTDAYSVTYLSPKLLVTRENFGKSYGRDLKIGVLITLTAFEQLLFRI